MLRTILCCLGLLGATTACTTSDDPAPAPTPGAPAVRILGVHPPETDAAIRVIYSTTLDSHMVRLQPSAGLKGRLFVFFPGTGAVPRNYRLIVSEAAAAGYHAIGLTYDNEAAVATSCAHPGSDLDCPGKLRSEILTGVDSSALRTVNRPNSVENRLLRLLQHLHNRFPGDGWNQFADANNNLLWSRIAVSGHSQGGGFSAYIGKVRPVLRVGMYSGGGDFVGFVFSNWMRRPGLTPATAYRGFTSPMDELASWTGPTGINAGWTLLGLGAASDTLVVDGRSSFGTTRQLLTRATPRNPGTVGGPHHNVSVVDVNTPLDAQGRPTLAPVWRYVSLPD